MKLSQMYNKWLEMLNHDNPQAISPLYSAHWIAREFGYTYQQSRKIFRLFMARLRNGYNL